MAEGVMLTVLVAPHLSLSYLNFIITRPTFKHCSACYTKSFSQKTIHWYWFPIESSTKDKHMLYWKTYAEKVMLLRRSGTTMIHSTAREAFSILPADTGLYWEFLPSSSPSSLSIISLHASTLPCCTHPICHISESGVPIIIKYNGFSLHPCDTLWNSYFLSWV